MSELRAYLGLYARGDASKKVSELDKAIEGMASRGSKHMGMLSRATSVMGQGLDNLGNRYTALLSGAAGIGAGKMVADLDERMTYLGINAGKTTEEMDALKRKVFEVAKAPNIRVDPGQILDAIDTIVEKTGDLEAARDNIENIGLAIRATRAGGADVGAWIAQLGEKFNVKGAEAVRAAIDHSVNAGKEGAFTFKDLAAQGERLTAAYGAVGRTGASAAAELDAMIQVVRKGVGSSDQATTAFEAMMRTLSDGDKRKKLQAHGIRLMDPEDPKRMRSIVDIYKDIITKSKGDVVKLGDIFDAEAIRAFNAGVTEFKTTGGLPSLDKFYNSASDGETLLKDAGTAAKTFNAAWNGLIVTGRQFADANLTEPVRELAAFIDRLEPEKVQATMKALTYGAAAVGGLVVANKAVGLARSTADTFRFIRGGKPSGKGGAADLTGVAGAVVGGGGPVPVMVMNWPGGGAGAGLAADLTGGGGGKGGATTAKGGLRGIASRAGRWLGRAGGALGGVLGAVDAASSFMDGDTRGAVTAVGRTLGGIGGGALGSLLGPVGTVAGGAGGAYGGEKLFAALYDYFNKDNEKAPEPMKGEMRVMIETSPGTTAKVTGLSSQSPGFEIDTGRMAMP